MYDVIVVGARCGGAPTAMLVARRGYRVLLVDRATFPSDMALSTHLVWPRGAARLQRWGMLAALEASGCPPLRETTFDVGAFALRAGLPAVDGISAAYAPRRWVLDGLLVEASTAAGAELWEGCTVDELLFDGDTVVGIRGRGPGGRVVQARGALVVGADGMRSRVARLVDAPTYHTRLPVEGTYFSYWSGVPAPGPELYPRPHRAVYVVPTHDDLTLVGVNWPVADWRAARSDIAGHHAAEVTAASPELAQRMAAGRREERWIGGAIPSFFRQPFGPGWALVGDAGYTKDPCTAQGISDAFEHAELLAAAIDDGLTGWRSMAAALAGYQHKRDCSAMPMYEFTSQMATLEPPTPEMVALLESLREDRVGTERFFGVFTGSVAVGDFFGAHPGTEAA